MKSPRSQAQAPRRVRLFAGSSWVGSAHGVPLMVQFSPARAYSLLVDQPGPSRALIENLREVCSCETRAIFPSSPCSLPTQPRFSRPVATMEGTLPKVAPATRPTAAVAAAAETVQAAGTP